MSTNNKHTEANHVPAPSVGSGNMLGHWRGKPLSQNPAAIKARAARAAYKQQVALEAAALERAREKLTPEEWAAVENHFSTYEC